MNVQTGDLWNDGTVKKMVTWSIAFSSLSARRQVTKRGAPGHVMQGGTRSNSVLLLHLMLERSGQGVEIPGRYAVEVSLMISAQGTCRAKAVEGQKRYQGYLLRGFVKRTRPGEGGILSAMWL